VHSLSLRVTGVWPSESTEMPGGVLLLLVSLSSVDHPSTLEIVDVNLILEEGGVPQRFVELVLVEVGGGEVVLSVVVVLVEERLVIVLGNVVDDVVLEETASVDNDRVAMELDDDVAAVLSDSVTPIGVLEVTELLIEMGVVVVE
jgi:hypothetical protein